MSEPAPEFPGLAAFAEKMLQLLAEIKLGVDGLSAVAAQTNERTERLAEMHDSIEDMWKIVEEARPLLESGPARFFARRRMLPQPGAPSGPPA